MGNDLEGQPRPLEVDRGIASEDLVVEGNYFEANITAGSKSLIYLALIRRFRVQNNQMGSATTLPYCSAVICSDGTIDQEAIIRECTDVHSDIGFKMPAAGIGDTYQGALYTNVPPHTKHTFAGAGGFNTITDTYAKFGNEVVGTVAVDGAYRTLYSVLGSCNVNEYSWFTLAIKYESEIPHAPLFLQLIGTVGGIVDVRQAWTFYAPSNMRIGDVLTIVVGYKNTTAGTMTAQGIYVSPYGNDTTVGSGARLTQLFKIPETTGRLPNVDPLELVNKGGALLPTTITGALVGDIALNAAPVAGSVIGWVCVAGGTPGTWKSFGPISA